MTSSVVVLSIFLTQTFVHNHITRLSSFLFYLSACVLLHLLPPPHHLHHHHHIPLSSCLHVSHERGGCWKKRGHRHRHRRGHLHWKTTRALHLRHEAAVKRRRHDHDHHDDGIHHWLHFAGLTKVHAMPHQKDRNCWLLHFKKEMKINLIIIIIITLSLSLCLSHFEQNYIYF